MCCRGPGSAAGCAGTGTHRSCFVEIGSFFQHHWRVFGFGSSHLARYRKVSGNSTHSSVAGLLRILMKNPIVNSYLSKYCLLLALHQQLLYHLSPRISNFQKFAWSGFWGHFRKFPQRYWIQLRFCNSKKTKSRQITIFQQLSSNSARKWYWAYPQASASKPLHHSYSSISIAWPGALSAIWQPRPPASLLHRPQTSSGSPAQIPAASYLFYWAGSSNTLRHCCLRSSLDCWTTRDFRSENEADCCLFFGSKTVFEIMCWMAFVQRFWYWIGQIRCIDSQNLYLFCSLRVALLSFVSAARADASNSQATNSSICCCSQNQPWSIQEPQAHHRQLSSSVWPPPSSLLPSPAFAFISYLVSYCLRLPYSLSCFL